MGHLVSSLTKFSAENNLATVIIDSVQTLIVEGTTSHPGSVNQVGTRYYNGTLLCNQKNEDCEEEEEKRQKIIIIKL